jgi:C4-dicarboxylate transporter DctQ subunit
MDKSAILAGSGLARFDRQLSRFEDLLNFIAAMAIFFLMLVGVVQIIGRSIFNLAIYGYIDYIEQSTAIFAFLGVAYCQRAGNHIRMEVALHLLPKRYLWIAEAVAVILAMAIITLIIDGSWSNFLRAYQLGDSTMDIQMRIWPGKLMVPLALSTLWLRLLLQLAGYIRLALYPDAEPVGVPVLYTPEDQAKSEIEETLGRTERGQG